MEGERHPLHGPGLPETLLLPGFFTAVLGTERKQKGRGTGGHKTRPVPKPCYEGPCDVP